MKIVCPHCAHHDEDGFEALDADVLHDDFRCVYCGTHFTVFINDCACRGSEQAFAWRTVPSTQELIAVACETCGHASASG